MERPELYQAVAHHVGIGCIARLHFFHGVTSHLTPILLVAVNHLQLAPIPSRDSRGHLHVLLRIAIPRLFLLRADTYVKTVWTKPTTRQLVHHHRTVNATRKQNGYALIFQLIYVHRCKSTSFCAHAQEFLHRLTYPFASISTKRTMVSRLFIIPFLPHQSFNRTFALPRDKSNAHSFKLLLRAHRRASQSLQATPGASTTTP